MPPLPILYTACSAIDRQITTDVHVKGIIQRIYEGASEKLHNPLVLVAGGLFERALKQDGPIILMGGFPIPHPYGMGSNEVHTDGLVGIVSLARSLTILSRGVVIVADEGLGKFSRSCLRAVMDTRDSRRIDIIEVPRNVGIEKSCDKIMKDYSPSLILSSEKPGKNSRGRYHSASGKDMTEYVSRSDVFFDLARVRIPTIAVGDIGNEAGMGLIREPIERVLENGGACSCPCKGSIISSTSADTIVLGTMSDWGVYGLISYLAVVYHELSLIPKYSEVRDIMEALALEAGLRDWRNLMTDEISLRCTASCLEILRDIAHSANSH